MERALRVGYEECQSKAEAFALIADLEPRTLVFDVEPFIAYRDTEDDVLDRGVEDFVTQVMGISCVQTLVFATNSNRTPARMTAHPGVRVIYLSSALKPFRTQPFQDLPKPGLVVGDQTATDGVLAYRLGYTFIRYRTTHMRLPLGPRLMGVVGIPFRHLLFRDSR